MTPAVPGRQGRRIPAELSSLVPAGSELPSGETHQVPTGGIGALALSATAPSDATARLAGQASSPPPQGLGDTLQTRLLAPIVLPGLLLVLIRRPRPRRRLHPHQLHQVTLPTPIISGTQDRSGKPAPASPPTPAPSPPASPPRPSAPTPTPATRSSWNGARRSCGR